MTADPPPLPPPAPRRWPTLVIGMLVSSALAGLLFFGLTKMLALYKGSDEGWLAIPNLFLVPFVAGLAAAWCWRSLNIGIGGAALHSLSTCLVAIGAAFLFLGEGVVCLIMGFPAFYVMLFLGVLLGRIWFRVKAGTVRLTIFPVLALLAMGDSFYGIHQTSVVTDEIVIKAPPDRVWPHVLAFSEIPDPANYWIFRVGLPYPTSTTNGGNFVGADRQCIFSDGIVIKERVAEFVPREKLTFDITEQPQHPESYGHISLHRGQFVLQDNGNGTTTLIGSSWYTLHTRPHWYFDLWARDMSHEVHLRVMRHVRTLAEAK